MSLLIARTSLTQAQTAAQTSSIPVPNPDILFDAPKPGQIFAPGDAVSIMLHVLSPLKEKVTDAEMSTMGMGVLPSPHFDFPNGILRWTFSIPRAFAGPITLNPALVAGQDPSHPAQPLMVVGSPLTIAVQPKEPPRRITLLEHTYILDWPGCCGPQQEQLYVKGDYAGVERDITAAEAGTTYHSSNQAVVTVDAGGSVRIMGPGTATITVENRGVTNTAGFVVEDQKHPLPPEDLTSQARFVKSTPALDPEAKAYQTYPMMAQIVTITNMSSQPMTGPLYLMVRDLPDGIQLWCKTENAPANPPPEMVVYFRSQTNKDKRIAIRLSPNDGLSFRPGENISQRIYFFLPGKEKSIPDVSLSLVRSTIEP